MINKKALNDYCVTVAGVLGQYDKEKKNMKEMEDVLRSYVETQALQAVDEFFKTSTGRETVLLALQEYRRTSK
jgi:hypothetical protein